MTTLHLAALPPQTTKGTIVRLLEQVGQINRDKIGAIQLRGREATIDVPDDWGPRLVKAMDGANLDNRNVRAWCDSGRDSHATADHFQRLTRWLEMEAEAEARQTLQAARRLNGAAAERSGNSLVGLAVRDETSGLGGRIIVALGKRDLSRSLPWT